jgi:anti-sigma regulatory factor (Ser/Thr protein kinase)
MLAQSSDGIGIEFMDSREPFDPTRVAIEAPADSIEAADIGGRGLMLLRAYGKDIAYRHDGTYNRVLLKIRST